MLEMIHVTNGPGLGKIVQFGPLFGNRANLLLFQAHIIPKLDPVSWHLKKIAPGEGQLRIGNLPMVKGPGVIGEIVAISRKNWDTPEHIHLIVRAQASDYRFYFLVFEYDMETKNGQGSIMGNEEFFGSNYLSQAVVRYVSWDHEAASKEPVPVIYTPD